MISIKLPKEQDRLQVSEQIEGIGIADQEGWGWSEAPSNFCMNCRTIQQRLPIFKTAYIQPSSYAEPIRISIFNQHIAQLLFGYERLKQASMISYLVILHTRDTNSPYCEP